MTQRRCCSGFTLVEVVVTLAILALLGAITIPMVFSTIDLTKVRDTATRLQNLRDAIYNPAAGANAFSQRVGANPGKLSQLAFPIVAGNAATHPNSCGGSFTNGQRNNWASTGPYVSYTIEPGIGLGTAMGRINDDLTRVPPNAAAGVIQLTISQADLKLVALLDEELNSGDGSAAGSVRWSAPVSGATTMTYVVPINNRC